MLIIPIRYVLPIYFYFLPHVVLLVNDYIYFKQMQKFLASHYELSSFQLCDNVLNARIKCMLLDIVLIETLICNFHRKYYVY